MLDYRTKKGLTANKVKPQYKTIPVVQTTTLDQDLRTFRTILEKNSINRYTYRRIAIKLKPVVKSVLRSVFSNELSGKQGVPRSVNSTLAGTIHPSRGDRQVAAGLMRGTFGTFVHWDRPYPEPDHYVPTTPFNLDGKELHHRKHPGIIFIFWDKVTATGYFIENVNPNPRRCRTVPFTLVEAEKCQCIILSGRSSDWRKGKIRSKLNKIYTSLGLRPSKHWALDKSRDRLISTTWSRRHATTVIKLLWQQQFMQHRNLALRQLNGLLNENPYWKSGLMVDVAAKHGTVGTYMSHIRDFADWSSVSTKTILSRIANRTLDIDRIHFWIWDRIHGEVQYTSAVNSITAFSWFHTILLNESFTDVHGKLFWIAKLRKHWSEKHQGALELDFREMWFFIKYMKEFQGWAPFNPLDIFYCAVLSLWGALRTGEALSLHLHDVHLVVMRRNKVIVVDEFQPGVLLRITLYNIKTAFGNTTVSKFVPPFHDNPDFCPVRAFLKLTRTRGSYFVGSGGRTLTQSLLNARLRKYVSWVSSTHMSSLLAGKDLSKLTWYTFRVSYFNIAVTQIGVPAHQTSIHGLHNCGQTLHRSYIHHTLPNRLFQNAKLVQKQASAYFKTEGSLE